MEIEVQWRDQVRASVRPKGDLTFATEGRFRRILTDSIETGHHRIELDLSDASHVDSSGLGAIISASKEARHSGGDITVVGASPNFIFCCV